GSTRSALRHHGVHKHAGVNRQLSLLRQLAVDIPNHHAEVTALHTAEFDQVLYDLFYDIGRHREAISRVGTRRRGDGRIDPHKSALQIHQRAARVAWVDGRIRLDK